MADIADLLWAWQSKDRSSFPGKIINAPVSMSPTPVLEPNQPSMQRVPGALAPKVTPPGPEAVQSPPSTPEVKKSGFIHPQGAHGPVLQYT